MNNLKVNLEVKNFLMAFLEKEKEVLCCKPPLFWCKGFYFRKKKYLLSKCGKEEVSLNCLYTCLLIAIAFP
jgi:hypothetical protein